MVDNIGYGRLREREISVSVYFYMWKNIGVKRAEATCWSLTLVQMCVCVPLKSTLWDGPELKRYIYIFFPWWVLFFGGSQGVVFRYRL